MCLTQKELNKIYMLLKKKKLKITSNLVLRVNDLFTKIKKKINKKKIFYIEADYIWGRKEKLFGWRSKTKNYSIVHGAAIHMIDLIIWITGLKPTFVYAIGNKKITNNTSFKKNSFAIILLEFPNKILAKVTANAPAKHEHFHELKIFSKDKTIVHSKLGSYITDGNNTKLIKSNYPDKENRKNLIRNFIDNLLEKKQNIYLNTKDQFDLMSVCFAIEKSIILKKKIKINYFK